MDHAELLEKLKKLDEVLLLELLEINSEQIVEIGRASCRERVCAQV